MQPAQLALLFGWTVRTAAAMIDRYWQGDENRVLEVADIVRDESAKRRKTSLKAVS